MRLLTAALLLVSGTAEAAFVPRGVPPLRWTPQAVVSRDPGRAFRLAQLDARPFPLTPAVPWTPPQVERSQPRLLAPETRAVQEVRTVAAQAPQDVSLWTALFDGTLSKREAAGLARITDFLGSQETIRVFMGEAPGNGHQAASVTVMRRLRELGFAGRFEVVYQPGVRAKLSKLLPGFNPFAGSHQTLDGLGAVLIPSQTFLRSPRTRVRLAITGADDYENPGASGMSADYFLVLQPQDWSEEATLQAGDEERIELPELTELGYVYRVARPADVPSFVKEEMAHDRALAAKVPGLVKVLSRKDHHLLPAYGLGFKGVKKLDRLVKALGLARPALGGKGVVIPVISSLDEEEVAKLKARLAEPRGRRSFFGWLARTQRRTGGGEDSSGVRVLSERDLELSGALDGLGEGEVLVVLIGPVTQSVFEFLFSQATLPATVAGKNAMNLMRLLGKPFLNTVGDHPAPEGSSLAPEDAVLIRDAHDALRGRLGSSLEDLAAFLAKSLDPESALSRFYKSLSPLDAPISKDKLAQGLLRVIELLEKKR